MKVPAPACVEAVLLLRAGGRGTRHQRKAGTDKGAAQRLFNLHQIHRRTERKLSRMKQVQLLP